MRRMLFTNDLQARAEMGILGGIAVLEYLGPRNPLRSRLTTAVESAQFFLHLRQAAQVELELAAIAALIRGAGL